MYESIMGVCFLMIVLGGAWKRKVYKTKNAEVVTGWFRPNVKA